MEFCFETSLRDAQRRGNLLLRIIKSFYDKQITLSYFLAMTFHIFNSSEKPNT